MLTAWPSFPATRHAAKAWFSAIHHALFLCDARTERVIGEPKLANAAVIKLSEDVAMNVHTVSVPFRPTLGGLAAREDAFAGRVQNQGREHLADTRALRRYLTFRTSGRR